MHLKVTSALLAAVLLSPVTAAPSAIPKQEPRTTAWSFSGYHLATPEMCTLVYQWTKDVAAALLSSGTATPSKISKQEPPAAAWPFARGYHLATPDTCALVYQWPKYRPSKDPDYRQVRMSIFDAVGQLKGETVQPWTKYGKFVEIPSTLPHIFSAEVVHGFNSDADPDEWWIDKAQYSYPSAHGSYPLSTARCSDKWTCYAIVDCSD